MKTTAAFLLLATFILFIWVMPTAQPPTDTITNFDTCARAGHSILESYPRQCTTPDGRTFIEEAVSEICRYQQDCGKGFYCHFGLCTELLPETSCQQDNDCMLIRNDHGFSCCWTGACEPIDYSQEQWIAANTSWFEQGHEEICPAKEDCGPAPLCAIHLINDHYQARCINNTCTKTDGAAKI